jgi:hypothetical protein
MIAFDMYLITISNDGEANNQIWRSSVLIDGWLIFGNINFRLAYNYTSYHVQEKMYAYDLSIYTWNKNHL